MATPTYELVSKQTLSSSTTSITFNSIPNTYKHLVFSIRATGNGPLKLQFNNDNNLNYANASLYAEGGQAPFGNFYVDEFINFGVTFLNSTKPNLFQIELIDYARTDKYKSLISKEAARDETLAIIGGTWENTSAISSVTFEGATYNAGSVFALYGLK